MTGPGGDRAVIDGRTVTSSAVVAAPPEAVFALIANPHRHHEFDGSGTVQAAVSGPERLALGDRFGMKMKLKVPYRITNRVVEFEPDRLIAWCHPARAIWRYELEPVDGGGTRVTETFDFRRSPVAFGIERLGMHRNNARSIRNTLRRLQEIFGSAAAAT